MTKDERAGVLHDLKNQLGIIVGFTEFLLADVAEDDPRFADMQEIRTAAGSAVALVARLDALTGPDGAAG